MKYSFLIILSICCLSAKVQASDNCDSIFYRAFYNFVRYNDSVGYSLTYHIESEHHTCLTDTVGLIDFLLSDRYLFVNSDAILGKEGDGLATTEMSWLAHHTNHSRIKPQTDSSYKNISNWRVQMIGSGRQLVLETPIDVLKLYFISALFYNNFEFRNEIVLIRKGKMVETYTERELDKEYPKGTAFEVKIKNKRIIKSALKSYKKWSKELVKTNLRTLRETNRNPLYYSKNIEWRNKQFDPFDGKEIKKTVPNTAPMKSNN